MTGVVYAVNCLSSKSLMVVKLLRYLVLLCLKFSIWIKARHVRVFLSHVAR